MSVILLGSDFMFNEELGTRLRGIGYTVKIFSDPDDLQQKLEAGADLVIIDLEKSTLGGLDSIDLIVSSQTKLLGITEHRSTELANTALNKGADKIVFNSQASKNIEMYVNELLG